MSKRTLTRRKFVGLVGAGGAALLLPSACTTPTTTPGTSATATAAATGTAAVNPGKLTVLISSLSSQRFDWVFAGSSAGEKTYGRTVHGPVIAAGDRAEPIPGILTKWAVSPDGKTWTFTIREGVRFHDGKELTMEDALWSMQHAFSAEADVYAVSTQAKGIAKAMDKIELGGPREIVFRLKSASGAVATQMMEAESAWFHVLQKRDRLHDTDVEVAYDRNPIGTGPMKILRSVQGDRIEFERFEDYYYQPKYGLPEDRRMKMQRMDLVVVPERSTRVSALRAGQADIASVALSDKAQIEGAGGKLIFGQEGAFLDAWLMGAHLPNNHFRDVRTRTALNLAVNRTELRDKIFGGPDAFQVKGFDGVTPSTLGYSTELDPLPYDPDRARTLLAAAGFPGGQGFGELVLNIEESVALSGLADAGQVIAASWKQILGLDVRAVIVDPVQAQGRRNSGEMATKGEAFLRTIATGRDRADLIFQYTDPTYPARRIDKAEIHKAVLDARALVDPDRRSQAFIALYKQVRAEVPDLSIGYANITWGVSSRVQTWQPIPLASSLSALHTISLKG